MQQNVYSIYDTKLQAFFAPFTAANDEVALRNYTQLANDENSRIAQDPNDYQLIAIGTWNDASGEIKPEKHRNLGFASEYQRDVQST